MESENLMVDSSKKNVSNFIVFPLAKQGFSVKIPLFGLKKLAPIPPRYISKYIK
jgi:hypothetical protein